jgi:hypothetical protein
MKSHIPFLFAAFALLLTTPTKAQVKLFAPPEGSEQVQAHNVSVQVNGQSSFVYDLLTRGGTYCNPAGRCLDTVPTQFTYFDMSPSSVAVDVDFGDTAIASATVDPVRASITPTISGHKVHFVIPRAGRYLLRVNGKGGNPPPLAIFANPPETNVPSPTDANVTFFKAGKIYDVGVIKPAGNNRTIYIEGGAVVRGAIDAEDVSGLSIRGRGVLIYDDKIGALDGINFRKGPITIARAQNISMSDIIIVESTTRFGSRGTGPTAPWAAHLAQIDNLHLVNVKILSELRDGVDVDGSQHVRVSAVFIQAGDDAFCIKSTPYGITGGNRNVEDVLVEDSQIFATIAGSAIEIGTELFADEVHDIHFQRIDVIDTLAHANAITIKNGGPAKVHDVTYEDIQINGKAASGAFEFSIVKVPGYPSPHPGSISNIKLQGIHLEDGNPQPPKVAVDSDQQVSGVEFSSLTFGHNKVTPGSIRSRLSPAANKGLDFK